MTSTEIFATAAHLHVLLRRKTGRVTDTEWMATNADYARAIVRFAREKAASEGLDELLPWAEKLETASTGMGAPVRKPLLQSATEALRAAQTPPPRASGRPSGFADSVAASGFRESSLHSGFGGGKRSDGDGPDTRYVGGIR
ncbi:hypothetical protein F3K02_17080 [Hydrogenophaga sp. D2P1]|uniref:Uncharacterized protein n=1 Tax=Hydrogenophaga aromaticivorans TaxID=2610898 RepID=A0A7Y8GZP0_9BURK|nr:hypothetical protein [Hydrogenophaga aromaticivorans]NWF46952.1 hypothetical protein [Hydrogenophaga aromaticivorans]